LYYKNKGKKHPNLLVINISPTEGITLYLNAKKTGSGNQAEPINLSYNHDKSDGINTPEAYEKLIYDCMAGDTTNFTHWDEVSLTWQFVTPFWKIGKQRRQIFQIIQLVQWGRKRQMNCWRRMVIIGGLLLKEHITNNKRERGR